MKSIRDLYKIGKGPSSSHTMGPARAAEIFKSENPDAECYRVVLYGSLSKTGVGHGTDRVIREVFSPKSVEVVFSENDPADLKHPNTLDFSAYTGDKQTAGMRVESIGGGDIVIEGRPGMTPPEVYPENSFAEIAQFCAWRRVTLPQYVEMNEGAEIRVFLKDVWSAMRREIDEGLSAEGILPGGLNVQRKAKYLLERGHQVDIPQVRELQEVCAYAFAAAEQNAGNGTVVTAPTCGSCGVLPAVLMYLQDPICGLVQSPCIERNAVAAKRAIDASNLAHMLVGTRTISFDMVVRTMYETGRSINKAFRETSEGGLARLYSRNAGMAPAR